MTYVFDLAIKIIALERERNYYSMNRTEQIQSSALEQKVLKWYDLIQEKERMVDKKIVFIWNSFQ